MLRLEIENLLSFKERVVIDLTVPGNATDPDNRFLQRDKIRTPKVVAFYGPNAAGKSNVLRVVSQLTWFLGESFSWRDGVFPFDPFLSHEMHARPSAIAVELIGYPPPGGPFPADQIVRYRYELTLRAVHGQQTLKGVHAERLTMTSPASKRPIKLFMRDESGKITGSAGFPIPPKLAELQVRQNCAAIAHLAQFNHEQARFFVSAARNIQSNIIKERYRPDDAVVMQQYLQYPKALDALRRRLSMLDLGLSAVEFSQTPSGQAMFLSHTGLDGRVSFNDESHGTQEFIRMFPWFQTALDEGSLAVIDELDQALHPHLVCEVVRWFQNPETNPHGAMLWFTSQTTDLMDQLQKEEIFLCEKGPDGHTSVTSLKDIQGVRRVDNFRRMYLSGMFGAVPRFG